MRANKSAQPIPAVQSGTLSLSYGYPALVLQDGRRYWLELQAIPFDLVDQTVRVAGLVHQANHIEVNRMEPE